MNLQNPQETEHQKQFKPHFHPDHPETQNESATDTKTPGGILKYYKKGDYFLAGTTTGDVSKTKGDQHNERLEANKNVPKQGTLLGVFFPVLQNILGVLLFIRVPAITGESGIRDSAFIVTICCCTTGITILSLCAIATNGRISKGGTYYLISRSLGAPVGTAVGFCFYLGTSFAGAMYILGAVESFITTVEGVKIADSDALSMRIYGTCLLAFLLFINLVGLKYVAKTGLVFLTVVLIAILGMYIGIFSQSARDPLSYYQFDGDQVKLNDKGDPMMGDLNEIEERYRYAKGITGMSSKNWEDNMDTRYTDNDFFILLSVYFPSVTGIMAGSNRSGDLADPAVAIPRGTLGAWIVTTIIYISFPLLFGAVADRNTLQTMQYLIAAECSWPSKYLTIVAIILSSTGAGLQCLAGAPKLFEAITDDDNLPCFRCLKGKQRIIILITGLICFGAVMIGDINVITPIITMFFLLCYGCVNLCCLFLDIVKFPNWRPQWKFYHKFLSLIGLGLCIFLMIAISWWSFLIVLALSAILFTVVIKNRQENENYGDSIDAVRMLTAKNSLIGLMSSSQHVKNWIPSVLIVGDYDSNKEHDNQISCKGAVFFLNTFKQDVSYVVYGTTHEGNYSIADCKKVQDTQKGLQKWFEKENLEILTKVVQVQKIDTSQMSEKEKQVSAKLPLQGIVSLIQSAGLGGFEPNLLCMDFPANFKSDPAKGERFVQFVSYGVRFGKAIFALVNDDKFAPKMEIGQIMPQKQKNKDVEGQQQNEDIPTSKRCSQENYKESIDVWTFCYENGLQILLAYFLKRSTPWKNCKVRIFILTLLEQNTDREKEIVRIQKLVETFLFRYRLDLPGIEIKVEPIEFDKYKQLEGFLIEQAKNDQIQAHPEQFANAPVDPTSNYQMNLNEQQQQQQQQQNGNTLNVNGAQKPQRALSVMSQDEVNALNSKIKSQSSEADLVIMNLPEPINQKTNDYLEYLRNMTQGLGRVVMIRNNDQECISEFT